MSKVDIIEFRQTIKAVEFQKDFNFIFRQLKAKTQEKGCDYYQECLYESVEINKKYNLDKANGIGILIAMFNQIDR